MEPTNKNEIKTNDNNKQAMRVMFIFAAMLIFVIVYAVLTKN